MHRSGEGVKKRPKCSITGSSLNRNAVLKTQSLVPGSFSICLYFFYMIEECVLNFHFSLPFVLENWKVKKWIFPFLRACEANAIIVVVSFFFLPSVFFVGSSLICLILELYQHILIFCDQLWLGVARSAMCDQMSPGVTRCIYWLHWVTLVPDDDFGKMTIY